MSKQCHELEQFKTSLGLTGQKMTQEELERLYSCCSSFIDSILDNREKEVFGKTIDQIINHT